MESGGWKGYYAWLELGEGCFMKIRDHCQEKMPLWRILYVIYEAIF